MARLWLPPLSSIVFKGVSTVVAPVAGCIAVSMMPLLLALALVGAPAIPKANAQASTKAGTQDSAQAAQRRAAAALEAAFNYVKAQAKHPPGTAVLAAQGTPEGHWRFVNPTGEMFTVGTQDEMKRVVTVLYPEAKKDAPLALYLTEDTILGPSGRLHALPVTAEKHVVVGGKSYPVPRAYAPFYAVVRPKVAVEMGSDPQLFKEALAHIDQPLREARVRLFAADSEADLGAALTGDPEQTLVVCARGEGDVLFVNAAAGGKPPAASEPGSIPVGDLAAAANVKPVALLVLQLGPSSQAAAEGTAPCPTGRKAAGELTLADILNAAVVLRGQGVRVAVALAGRRRVLIEQIFLGDMEAGKLPEDGGTELRDAGRGVPGRSRLAEIAMPALAVYAALLMLGLLGTPVARGWGSKLWPPEEKAAPTPKAMQPGKQTPPAQDKALEGGAKTEENQPKKKAGKIADPKERNQRDKHVGLAGYWAASLVRFVAFVLIFLPLTAVIAAPYSLFRQIYEAITRPREIWRWSKKSE